MTEKDTFLMCSMLKGKFVKLKEYTNI